MGDDALNDSVLAERGDGNAVSEHYASRDVL